MKQTLTSRLTLTWEILRGLGAYNLYHSSNPCCSYLVRQDSLLPENSHNAVSSPREIAYGLELGTRIPSFPALRLNPVITSGMSDNPVTSVSLLASGNAINSKGTTTTCVVCDVCAPQSIIVRISDSPDSKCNCSHEHHLVFHLPQ